MKRVLIIGNAGSGKTTLAKKLSLQLKIPLVSLDSLFWKPGWVELSRAEFDQLLQIELEKPAWIIDGNYNRTLAKRLKHADTVFFIDSNRFLCTWRVFKRKFLTKENQAPGCPQKIDVAFLKYVFWDYYKKNRKRVLALRDETSEKVKWI